MGVRISVKSSNGRLQLVYRYGKAEPGSGQGKRHYLSLGLPDTPANWALAQGKAQQLSHAILAGTHDQVVAAFRQDALTLGTTGSITGNLQVLWNAYVESRAHYVSSNTIHKDYARVTRHLERCPYRAIADALKIQKWANVKLSPDAARRFLLHLSACCKWAVENEDLPENPFGNQSYSLKKSQEDRDIYPFTAQERDSLIEVVCNHSKFSYYAPLFQFLFFTGCRPSEALALHPSNCRQGLIIFDRTVRSGANNRFIIEPGLKTQKKREFPVNGQLRAILDLALKNSTKDLVFPSKKGRIISPNNLSRRAWTQCLEAANLNHRRMYQTRHTFITLCLYKGIPPHQIAQWVGNSTKTLLAHYAGYLPGIQVPEI